MSSPLVCYAKSIIKIESQKDFDNITTSLNRNLSSGEKDIIVEFTKGQYYYKLSHIYFSKKIYPDVSITFNGNGSTIISDGKNLKKGRPIKYMKRAGFIDSNGDDYHNYSPMFQSDSIVEILDVKSKLCRIHCSDLNKVNNVDCTYAYIRLTAWYISYLYHIEKISHGYVYFIADNLELANKHYGDYNVNHDFTVGKVLPRFRLINVSMGSNAIVSTSEGLVNKYSDKDIHQCEAGYFLFFTNSKFKRLIIEGFNIIGCRSDCQLIRLIDLKAESIVIKNNIMSATRGVTIFVDNTDNISIESCVFHDNYSTVTYFSNTCTNIIVKNNKFFNNGKGVRNNFCVHCSGANYLISKNEIFDFNYGAIGVGVHYKLSKGSRPCYGKVERNHIYYTPNYIKDKKSWTLIDGGAIYLWTKNDGAIICNNFIHDYEGMGSNRGIYCDDGTSNCTIYGNIILNIGNSYSIDLRLTPSFEEPSIGFKSNVNNRIYSNCFNNRFRFQGRKNDFSSIKGSNTILLEDDSEMPRLVKDNLVEKSPDRKIRFDKQKWYKKGLRLVH